MGTRFDMVLCGIEKDSAEEIFNRINNEVLRLEKKLSYFDQDSIVHHLNATAHLHPVDVDNEIWDVLIRCKQYNELCQGCFDITIRPLIKYWTSDKQTSNPDEFTQIQKSSGMDKIIFDHGNRTIFFQNGTLEIDLGGFGKGFALEKVKGILVDSDLSGAFVSFGESSILALGNHPHGGGWKTGILDLFDKNKILYTYHLKDESLSISANYTPDSGDPRSEHIIQPISGHPLRDPELVSVSTTGPLDAEVLSTALLVADLPTKQKIIENFLGLNAIHFTYQDDSAVLNKLV